jgi:hypothetical protein
MKKISSLLILFCFIATSISYAQFFREQSDDDNSSSGSNSAVYDSKTGNSGSENNDDNGGFFRSSSADNPGGRPGNGGGIGQEAPIKDGLHVLIGCCLVLAVVKSVNEKRKINAQYNTIEVIIQKD